MLRSEFSAEIVARPSGRLTVIWIGARSFALLVGRRRDKRGRSRSYEWFLALQTKIPKLVDLHLAGTSAPRLSLGPKIWHNCCRAVTIRYIQTFTYRYLSDHFEQRSFQSSLAVPVLRRRQTVATSIYQHIEATYPIVLTRDLAQARAWLKSQARGSERIGLVASAGASRLKPEGINVHEKIDASCWFLNGKPDVRSSYYRTPATQFDIQGLELDWVGVCWDADFRLDRGEMVSPQFQRTPWKTSMTLQTQVSSQCLSGAFNAGPPGNGNLHSKGRRLDDTRPPSFYDGTALYPQECGLKYLEQLNVSHRLVT